MPGAFGFMYPAGEVSVVGIWAPVLAGENCDSRPFILPKGECTLSIIRIRFIRWSERGESHSGLDQRRCPQWMQRRSNADESLTQDTSGL